jgi:hypothetical protein
VKQQWKPLKKDSLRSELSELLKELGWNAALADKGWSDRPDEAYIVSDLKDAAQQAYIEFMHQCIESRKRQATRLVEEIRDEWRRIGYDSGSDELIEQGWQTHRFKKLADVPREEDHARAYLDKLRQRPDKGNAQSATSVPPVPTPHIPKTQSAPTTGQHSSNKPTTNRSVFARGGTSSLKEILQESEIQKTAK